MHYSITVILKWKNEEWKQNRSHQSNKFNFQMFVGEVVSLAVWEKTGILWIDRKNGGKLGQLKAKKKIKK